MGLAACVAPPDTALPDTSVADTGADSDTGSPAEPAWGRGSTLLVGQVEGRRIGAQIDAIADVGDGQPGALGCSSNPPGGNVTDGFDVWRLGPALAEAKSSEQPVPLASVGQGLLQPNNVRSRRSCVWTADVDGGGLADVAVGMSGFGGAQFGPKRGGGGVFVFSAEGVPEAGWALDDARATLWGAPVDVAGAGLGAYLASVPRPGSDGATLVAVNAAQEVGLDAVAWTPTVSDEPTWVTDVPAWYADPRGNVGGSLGTGDFDGDGLVDLSMGVPISVDEKGDDDDQGRVVLALGSGSLAEPPGPIADLDVMLWGREDEAGFGTYQAVPGDVTGDGRDDLMVYAFRRGRRTVHLFDGHEVALGRSFDEAHVGELTSQFNDEGLVEAWVRAAVCQSPRPAGDGCYLVVLSTEEWWPPASSSELEHTAVARGIPGDEAVGTVEILKMRALSPVVEMSNHLSHAPRAVSGADFDGDGLGEVLLET